MFKYYEPIKEWHQRVVDKYDRTLFETSPGGKTIRETYDWNFLKEGFCTESLNEVRYYDGDNWFPTLFKKQIILELGMIRRLKA